MSYRTWVTIQVEDFGTMPNEEARKAFESIVKEADFNIMEPDFDNLFAQGEDNNECSLDTLVEESRKYPRLTLEGTVDGTSEESDDQRQIRIRNGRIETVYMTKTFAPFTKILTPEEQKDRKEHPAYDPRLEEALKLLSAVAKAKSRTMGKNTMAHINAARKEIRRAIRSTRT